MLTPHTIIAKIGGGRLGNAGRRVLRTRFRGTIKGGASFLQAQFTKYILSIVRARIYSVLSEARSSLIFSQAHRLPGSYADMSGVHKCLTKICNINTQCVIQIYMPHCMCDSPYEQSGFDSNGPVCTCKSILHAYTS